MKQSIYEAFAESAVDAPKLPFLCVPPGRDTAPEGLEWTYAEVANKVGAVRAIYADAGLGLGHRVALLLGNHPNHFVHFLALNGLGASQVPVNPDYSPDELAYLLDSSQAELLISAVQYLPLALKAALKAVRKPPVIDLSAWGTPLPRPRTPASVLADDTLEQEAALLYTSGTTARPKACQLTNHHFLRFAQWYIDFSKAPASRIKMISYRERLFNPLPVYHVSAGALSPITMILTRGCLIMPGRFSVSRWWPEVVATRATILHYIGLVPAALMNQPPVPEERAHQVKWGLGAGIEPSLHAAFEERFGFPHLEVWGMTEIAGFTVDDQEPRTIGQRAFGKAIRNLECKIVDNEGQVAADDVSGHLLVRTSGSDAKAMFFKSYLGNPEANEAAWEGGWFHTGDIARRDASNMMYFVDRAKNIIRRSGENIAAGEVEAVLQAAPEVEYVAVIAVPDEMRQEEVFACIVIHPAYQPDSATAQCLFDLCKDKLAYYKAPGWLLFTEKLPMTDTQKVQKAKLFTEGVDPRMLPGVMDFRAQKRQQR